MAMRTIEDLTDAEIEETDRSAGLFGDIRSMTAPLDAFLTLIHAFEWLDIRDPDGRTALRRFLQGAFGDPVRVAGGEMAVGGDSPVHERFARLVDEARSVAAEQRFLNWQTAFPGMWTDWDVATWRGAFDAVIGNPPWDRVKLQQVEWFSARRPAIARQPRAADRKRMTAALQQAGDSLALEYRHAAAGAESAARVARRGGNYPLLSGGDVNLYSLFVERALSLVQPDGLVGLVVPSGIAADKTAARFFRSVATEGRLRALYDFENRRTRFDAPPFFPGIDSRQKFCVFVAGRSPATEPTRCGFFFQDLSELEDERRVFPLAPDDFARLNPNTATAPVFRSRRDAALTTAIYARLPVLVDRSADAPAPAWPLRYECMFPHDERFSPIPPPRRAGGWRGRLADRRQPVRQPERRVAAAL